MIANIFTKLISWSNFESCWASMLMIVLKLLWWLNKTDLGIHWSGLTQLYWISLKLLVFDNPWSLIFNWSSMGWFFLRNLITVLRFIHQVFRNDVTFHPSSSSNGLLWLMHQVFQDDILQFILQVFRNNMVQISFQFFEMVCYVSYFEFFEMVCYELSFKIAAKIFNCL